MDVLDQETYGVSSVLVGVCFNALQDDSKSDLVATFRLQRDRSVLGVTGFGGIA